MQVRSVARFAIEALERAAAVALAWGVWRRSGRRGTGRRGTAGPPSGGVHDGLFMDAKCALRVPADVRVVVLTPLAYPEPADYREAAAERLGQRTRLPLRETAFEGAWGESWSATDDLRGAQRPS